MVRKVSITLILFLATISFSVFANGKEVRDTQQKNSFGMMGSMTMMNRGKMRKMMPKMYGMMNMMSKSIVAVKDGGVIVMVGNRLLKYDKNLNLKKEVQINVNIPQMMKKMRARYSKMMKEESEKGYKKEKSMK